MTPPRQSYSVLPSFASTSEEPLVFGTRDAAIFESCKVAKTTNRTQEVTDRGVIPARVIGKAHGGSGRWEWVTS